MSGIYGNPGQTNYGAAKAGIAAFTNIAALELARYGVTVNAVAPGRADPDDRGPRPGAGDRRGARGAGAALDRPDRHVAGLGGVRRRHRPRLRGVAARSWPSPRAGSAARSTAPIDDPTQLGAVVAELLAKARPNSGMDGAPGVLAADHADSRLTSADRHDADAQEAPTCR